MISMPTVTEVIAKLRKLDESYDRATDMFEKHDIWTDIVILWGAHRKRTFTKEQEEFFYGIKCKYMN